MSDDFEPQRIKPAPENSDPVVERYKQHVDRTLLRENLKLSPHERLLKLIAFLRFADELRAAGRRVS